MGMMLKMFLMPVLKDSGLGNRTKIHLSNAGIYQGWEKSKASHPASRPDQYRALAFAR